jgi:hypothetical protein
MYHNYPEIFVFLFLQLSYLFGTHSFRARESRRIAMMWGVVPLLLKDATKKVLVLTASVP